jgi:hypothetical protein
MSFRTLLEPLRLNRAVLGFSGWPDAGKIVSRVISELETAFHCRPAAAWNMDGYWCTDSTRPEVLVQHGQIRQIHWPEYRFSLCSPPGSEPFLLGIGPEPAIRWRTFVRKLMTILKRWECKEIILLGSLYDQIFHDEVIFSGVVQDASHLNLIRELGCRPVDFKGTCAIHSAIMEASPAADIQSLSIWSHYPFYLDTPHELLTARLLDVTAGLAGFEFDTRPLLAAWRKRDKEIEELIHSDEDLRQMIEGMKREEPATEPGERMTNVLRLDEFLKKRKE